MSTGDEHVNGSAIYRAAKDAWGRGWSVIPLDHPAATGYADDEKKMGTIPAIAQWEPFQHRVATAEEVFC